MSFLTLPTQAAWQHVSVREGFEIVFFAPKTLLTSDGEGHWWIDGRAAPELEGIYDVDLESSSFTNAFPMNRLALEIGQKSQAPAAWVRAFDLSVERLEQSYVRLPNDGARGVFDYDAPSNEFQCKLTYDTHGLVLDYPGIAVRVSAEGA
jgi:hypothetical protein